MKLLGQKVLITGGSSGIGAALTKAAIGQGAGVYSIDIQKPKEPISEVTYIQSDLTNETEVKDAIEQIDKEIGVLALSVGIMRRGTIFETTESDFYRLMETNLKTSWLTLKYIKSKLSPNATIIQISSGHVLHPESDPGMYTVSKKAVTSLAEVLALTCPEYNVKIVYPGPVLTPLLLEGRSEQDKERIAKIAQDPKIIANKIIELVESEHKTLKFLHEEKEYIFE